MCLLIRTALFLAVALLNTGAIDGQTPAKPKAEKAFPTPPPPPGDVTLIRDIQYGKGGGVPLYLHLALPNPALDKPVPVILVIHGGGWAEGTRDSRLQWAYRFAQHGFAGATIDYRLSDQAPFPAQIQDCKCAVRYLRASAAKYRLDPERLGLMGDSAGGHLTALLSVTENVAEFDGDGGNPGVSSRVQAACDWYGPTDFLAWFYDPKVGSQFANAKALAVLFGGPPLENPARARWASPMTYVASSVHTPPFLIVHGDQDPTVPLNQSLALADALDKKGADVTLRVIPNAGHGVPHFWESAWPDMLAFFDRTLKAKR